ncbi:RapZ C-terminal domain-containing protein [Streptomyces cinereoruber]|uniref:RapZ C-terminal domain-containing protein n=1 Tax=Streptomyces cinereoruber TaxID=67260 RepID=UPI00363D3914
MRYRTGLDDDVYAHVLATPGALTLINRTAVQLYALADEVSVGRLVRLTVACQGGRHRSVAAAETVGRLVWEVWDGAYGVDIEHHHIAHPVLSPSAPA